MYITVLCHKCPRFPQSDVMSSQNHVCVCFQRIAEFCPGFCELYGCLKCIWDVYSVLIYFKGSAVHNYICFYCTFRWRIKGTTSALFVVIVLCVNRSKALPVLYWSLLYFAWMNQRHRQCFIHHKRTVSQKLWQQYSTVSRNVSQTIQFYEINLHLSFSLVAVVWQMMRAYTLSVLQRLAGSDKPISDPEIVEWTNTTLREAGKSTSISGFKDSSIANSMPVIDLVDTIKPGSIKYELVNQGASLSDEVCLHIGSMVECQLHPRLFC